MGIAPDLPAHTILILVEGALVGTRDVATIEARIKTLLMADHAVLGVQIMGLTKRNTAVAIIAVDPHILHRQAMIHFGAARMMQIPRIGGSAACGGNRSGGTEQRDQKGSFEWHDRLLCQAPELGRLRTLRRRA